MKKFLFLIMKLILCMVLFINSNHTFGQEVISSAGDFHSSGNHSVSWTIGEPVIDTWSASGTVLTQGFQQPILVSVSIFEHPDLNYSIQVFPNPTSDFLNLEVEDPNFNGLWYYLFDSNGKLLDKKEIISEHTEIMFTHLPVATYFIRIIHKNTEIKTFKILKH